MEHEASAGHEVQAGQRLWQVLVVAGHPALGLLVDHLPARELVRPRAHYHESFANGPANARAGAEAGRAQLR